MADPPIDLHCRHFENSLRRDWDIGMSAFQPRALQGCSWATLGSYILQPHVSVKRLKRVRSHLARDAKLFNGEFLRLGCGVAREALFLVWVL